MKKKQETAGKKRWKLTAEEKVEKRKQKLWYDRDRRSSGGRYDLWIRKHGDSIHYHHYGSASVYGEK